MRAIVAKKLRRRAYGKGHHPGPVVHYHHPKIYGVVVADEKRQVYQQIKRAYRDREFSL